VNPRALVFRLRCLFWCRSACCVSAWPPGGIKIQATVHDPVRFGEKSMPPISIRCRYAGSVRDSTSCFVAGLEHNGMQRPNGEGLQGGREPRGGRHR